MDDTPAVVDDNDEGDDLDDDFSARPTPAVIRIAVYASVQLIDKYLDHIWDCEIYAIAISKLESFFKLSSTYLQQFSPVPRSQNGMVQGPKAICTKDTPD